MKKGKRGGRWKESKCTNLYSCVAELDLAQDAVVDATLLRVVVLVECSTHDRVVIDHNSVPTFCWLGRVELILELYTKTANPSMSSEVPAAASFVNQRQFRNVFQKSSNSLYHE